MKLSFKLMLIVVLSCVFASAQTQTPAAAQHFDKGGLAFDYPNGWTMKDMSSEDAQEFGFSNNAADIQMRMFVHKGKVPADKLPAAKEAFIDPYVSQVEKQFVQMGATPTKSLRPVPLCPCARNASGTSSFRSGHRAGRIGFVHSTCLMSVSNSS